MFERKGSAMQSSARPQTMLNWFERLWTSIAERGMSFAPIPLADIPSSERAKLLAASLLTERGEASGAALARELLLAIEALSPESYDEFLLHLSRNFQPQEAGIVEAARAYLDNPTPQAAAHLANAAEPPRQELLRRINMGPGGTAALVQMRARLPSLLPKNPEVALLDADLRHLFSSWFNRGFLDLRQIDWQTPAAVLEKLIAYEAVHEIQGWDDLRRRLAPDRRCFAFFHPALPGEPLIFVEVALVKGLAGNVEELLELDTDIATQRRRAMEADTAIFYSISNCQEGLRGISFGNFLIKQVVEDLRAELPGLKYFSTLSPVPGFARWLKSQLDDPDSSQEWPPRDVKALLDAAGESSGHDEKATLKAVLHDGSWRIRPEITAAVRPLLLHLCALYLTQSPKGTMRLDPVARFHLGNGARLERINWMGNLGERGLRESFGIMVNYLYDPGLIEANHEAFTRDGRVIYSAAISELIESAKPKSSLIPHITRRARLH